MKKSNFKLVTLGLFSFLFCSLLIVSCTKEPVNPLAVELSTIDNNVTEIDVTDPDVQEFIKVRDLLVTQYASLRKSNKDAILSTLEDSEEINDVDVFAMFEISKIDAKNYIDIMLSSKENLTQKYPYLEFDQMNFTKFLYRMGYLFPVETSSRSTVCEESCDAAAAISTLLCNLLDTPDKIKKCKAGVAAAHGCCKAICIIWGSDFRDTQTEPVECQACGCGPGPGTGTGPGTGGGPGTGIPSPGGF